MIVYKLFLAQQCQHRLNRMVLGGIMVVSIVALPALLSLPEESHFTPVAEVGLPMAVGFTTDGVVAASTPHIDIMSIVEMLIVAGAVLMLLRLLVATGRIMALIQRGESIRYDDFTLVLIDRPEIAPFSFFKKVVVSRADYERHGEMIATHELAHICSRHWFDLLSAEILLCVQWYNPAAWLMLAQLREVHEYEADEKVVTSGFDKKKYQYLLLEKAAGVCFQSCANSLNHSKLKKPYRYDVQIKKFAWAALARLGDFARSGSGFCRNPDSGSCFGSPEHDRYRNTGSCRSSFSCCQHRRNTGRFLSGNKGLDACGGKTRQQS